MEGDLGYSVFWSPRAMFGMCTSALVVRKPLQRK
jgi:hypothetical protein